MHKNKICLFAALFSSMGIHAGKDIIFEDFESGNYNKWQIEGTAFGKKPLQTKDIPKYQGKMHSKGKYLINSHAQALGDMKVRDRALGKMTSEEFTINRKWISLLINGGADKNKVSVQLVVEGKVVATRGGANNNVMQLNSFDTAKYIGKKAKILIIDNHPGSWGNIGVDHIVFTDTKPKFKKAKKPFKKTQSNRKEVFSPDAQLKSFKLPEGFTIELVASEEHGVINPIDLTFDDAGRLWTQTAEMYPLDPSANIRWNELLKLMDDPKAQQTIPEFRRIKDLYQGKTKGKDKVLIIEKPWSEPSKAKVFADGLAIPQSILPYKGGAFVAHGSEMIFLNDSDGDDRADDRKTILTGLASPTPTPCPIY